MRDRAMVEPGRRARDYVNCSRRARLTLAGEILAPGFPLRYSEINEPRSPIVCQSAQKLPQSIGK
jgi:hypothetical protein